MEKKDKKFEPERRVRASATALFLLCVSGAHVRVKVAGLLRHQNSNAGSGWDQRLLVVSKQRFY